MERQGVSWETIRRRAVEGVAVQAGIVAVRRSVDVARTLVLIRLLPPSAFGMYAFAELVARLARLVATPLHPEEASIQAHEDPRRFMDTAFTAYLVASAAQAAILVAVAPWILSRLAKPHLTYYVQVLALVGVLNVLYYPARAGLARALEFRSRAVPELARVLVSAAVSVVLALRGFGTWSLILGPAAGLGSATVLGAVMAPRYPRLQVDRDSLARLWAFSWPLYLNGLLAWAFWNGDDLLVGMLAGDRALGLYNRAFWLPHAMMLLLGSFAGSVAFPLLSRLDDPRLVERAFRHMTRMSAVLILGPAAILGALSTPFVHTVFGEAWTECATPLTVFCVAVMLRGLIHHFPDLMMSRGSNRPLMLVSAINAGTMVPLAAVLLPRYGLLGAAFAVLVPLAVTTPVAMVMAGRLVGYGFLRDLVAPAVAAAGAAMVARLAAGAASGWLALILVGGGVGLAYVVVVVTLDPQIAAQVRHGAVTLRSRRPSSTDER